MVHLFYFSTASATDFGATLLGIGGGTLLHESGHALGVKLVGGTVEKFRPFPSIIEYRQNDGTAQERIVGGYVKYQEFEGDRANSKTAFVAAMGSATNLVSVFLLAPFLPEINSEFARASLDSMLLFSAWDAGIYATANAITKDPHGDWSSVARNTDVSIYWYVLTNVTASIVANEYRVHWHKKAFPDSELRNHLTFGFSAGY